MAYLKYLFIYSLFILQDPVIEDWVGEYYGVMDSKQAVLNIEAKENKLVGEINAEGYYYQFNTSSKEDHITGYISDIQTGDTYVIAATMDGKTIDISIEGSHYVFTSDKPIEVSKTKELNAGLDQELVGGWRYTEIISSETFSVARENKLILNKKGTYTLQIGDSDGKGDAGDFSTGTEKTQTGNWKTANEILYFQEDTEWVAYASYMVDEDALYLEFENGEEQTWKRF